MVRSSPSSNSRSPLATRREMLRGLAGLGLAALGGCAPQTAGIDVSRVDPETAALVDSVIGVDMHSHAAGAIGRAAPTYDLGAAMRRGRLTALCLGHSADSPVIVRDADNRVIVQRTPAPNELWQYTLRRLDWSDSLVRSQGLRRFLKPGDLEAAQRDGAPGVVQMIEGSQFLEGKLERVEAVHRRGVRHLQLVHYLRSDLGDNQTESPVTGGMTSLGADTIAECNRLGIVVDVAHGTMPFVEAAAKASTAPLVLSHTSVVRGELNPFSRRITGDHGRVVAQTDGVVGIWANPSSFNTLRNYVDGLARAVDALGADHVGFGTDNSGFGRTGAVWDNYADFPVVVGLMRKRGFSPEDIRKLAGGNYVRVFNRSMRA